MDVLDKYKETWKNQPEEQNKLSKVDIYKIAHKKSSSVVKWIFIVGILEFVFLTSINFIFRINPDEHEQISATMMNYLLGSEILSYVIMIYFLIKFYQNYKSISTADNTKVLIEKVLKTRKTVKKYVLINLTFVTIALTFAFTYMIFTRDFGHSETSFYVVLIFGIILLLSVIVLLYWLFYQLLYGILLRKLKHNYKELVKLDELN